MISFNNGMRLVQDMKGKSCEDMASNNVPSFMDDPNGYLAQQTVLLNNTISRQVGINSSFDGNQYDSTNNCYGGNNQQDKSCKTLSKSCDMTNVYRSNMVPNPSPSLIIRRIVACCLIKDKTIHNAAKAATSYIKGIIRTFQKIK